MTPSDLQPLLHYVEEWGLLFDHWGLNRTAGRIWGWLQVCEPAEQTAPQLVDALQVSKASISTNVRMLDNIGLVERVGKPGARQSYYRMRPDCFGSIMRERIGAASQARQVAERGLDLLEAAGLERRRRLEATRDFYAFLEREMEKLLGDWREGVAESGDR